MSFFDNGFLLLKKVLSISAPGICITEMHTAATDKFHELLGNKLGELNIRMRNCKMPKTEEDQSIDYAVIHAAKKSLAVSSRPVHIFKKRL
jgi:hypothetical protein